MAKGRDLSSQGGRIREAREVYSFLHRDEPDMTQQRLGELLGVDQSTVSEWERNTRPITTEMLAALAKVLGESPAWLAWAEGEPQAHVRPSGRAPTGTHHNDKPDVRTPPRKRRSS